MNRTLIIAEAGVNHNGSFEKCLDLIDKAKEAGADIIKFQTFNAEDLATKNSPKANYQKKHKKKDTQFKMLKNLELKKSFHIKLKKYCKKKNLIAGNLFPKRDFTYVTDTVNAFYQISKSKLAIGKTLNFGSGSEIEVASLVNLIMTKLNKNKKIIIDNKRKRSKKSEVNRLFCDNRKFFETLGLKRKKLISLEQGLTKTIFFLKNNLIKYNNKVDLYNI